jgi:hypothetical protein
MAQSNKVCSICGELGHSKFYCKKKPAKLIKRSAIKQKVVGTSMSLAKKKPVKKRITRGHVIKQFDTVFSRYIRLKNAEDGMTTCVTCGDVAPWKQHQNGHFFTRGRYPTRWDEFNCAPQCVGCNIFLKGNYINYTRYMIDTYGREFVDELERKSLATIKIPTITLLEYTAFYKEKVEKLMVKNS